MWLSNLSKDQHQALIRLAHNVIVSDGLLDPNEEGMFDLMKKEMGIENSEEVEYLSLDGIETIFPDRKRRRFLRVSREGVGVRGSQDSRRSNQNHTQPWHVLS